MTSAATQHTTEGTNQSVVLLDKSALLGIRLKDLDRTLGVSPTLWAEVWLGNPDRQADCLKALNANADRIQIIRPFEALLQTEALWRNPTANLIDETRTAEFHEHGFPELDVNRVRR